MKSLITFTSPVEPCGYLPDRMWRLKYEIVGQITPGEYEQRMNSGWRRFGYSLFTPDCETCRACQSLRVDVRRFRPDRSQRRAEAANRDLTIAVGPPSVSIDRIDLYDRFHRYQELSKGWPGHREENPGSYLESFVNNPFVTQEWCYRIGDRLVGVGYVDRLPGSLSAIYFFYDPDERDRSLGTFNVLSILRAARIAEIPYVYLGYFVSGCRSLEYKARFQPNEVLNHATGDWTPFLNRSAD